MRKKILFLYDSMPFGGVESALINLVSFLDKEKYDVSVVLLSERGDMYEEAKRRIPMKSVFEKFIPCQNRIIRKVRSVIINFLEKKRPKYPRLYHRFAIGGGYDMEISFNQYESRKVLAKSSNKHSKKILWVHENFIADEHTTVYWKGLPEPKKGFRAYDRIVFVSKVSQEGFNKYEYAKEFSVSVQYNIIDRDEIISKSKSEIDRRYNITGAPDVFCAVGRLVELKGFVRLVNICAALKKKGLNFKLILVGDGPEREKIEKAIADNEVQDIVIMTGYDDNPYKYVARSKFFVCSSFTEGLPVVCQEALALGIPVVSSFPSVGELFGDETCGILSDVDDDSLMCAIEKMLTDDVFYKKCKAGAEKRSEYFDPKNSVKEIERMFDELLENS